MSDLKGFSWHSLFSRLILFSRACLNRRGLIVSGQVPLFRILKKSVFHAVIPGSDDGIMRGESIAINPLFAKIKSSWLLFQALVLFAAS
ncbi:MAG TPA: hypothetical protein VN429_09895 [Methanospirillum sp.]|uniref:hypothetical protein n=1 Tax=Methanospirillum sp. TaxID=45200 RepID=UPI002C87CD4C|nr:hypothetical protein [Methanospirillum sp.]HWQ64714.1 hypothetical protein [Methanospirillum sp.]